jgi:hypothetical protein
MHMGRGTILLGLLALLGCGAQEPAPKAAAPAAPVYDRLRPCTLLTQAEAEQLAGEPFFRLMSDNRVLGPLTTCGYAMGRGGLQGMIQFSVVHGDAETTPEAHLQRRCDDPDAVMIPDPTGRGGRGCRLASGLLVLSVGDVVIEGSVQQAMGTVDDQRTDKLITTLAPRAAAAR